MKTNRFENTIRRKLESIEPDFQEQDWANMQRYMNAHNPPGFLQQYGSWIGYAAAASVTTIMALMYTSQLSQNNELISDVRNLKSQIEMIRAQPASTAKTDTIYIVQATPPAQETPVQHLSDSRNKTSASPADFYVRERYIRPASEHVLAREEDTDNARNTFQNAPDERSANPINATSAQANQEPAQLIAIESNVPDADNVSKGAFVKNDFGAISEKAMLTDDVHTSLERQMNYKLANRLSGRQFRKDMGILSGTQLARTAVSPAKAENVIPKFDVKVPYRFGGGLQFEGNGQAKTVVGEVLLAKKKLSISSGVSWLKVKSMEFMSEKIFREKNQKDFKKVHPNEVPYALEVFNIKVNPTVVQIPLTVAFRNNLKDNWAYSVGAGTNLSVNSKEEISFDCRTSNKEYFKKTFEKETQSPAFSSMNFTFGIEKTWHPIIIQAEGYLYTYFTPLSPLSNGTGPGVRFRLLYQIGGKM